MRRTLGGAVVAALLLGFIAVQGVNATHQPANKVAASASAEKVMRADGIEVLFEEQIRTSNPADLAFALTAECVITNTVKTVGNEANPVRSQGRVRMWVEFDGVPVPVASANEDDPGKVTFCDRVEQRQTSNFDDTNATIETLHQLGTANAFNWVLLNTGKGVHTVTVKAQFFTSATPDKATATAAVGKRTFIIEPVKAANDESLTDL